MPARVDGPAARPSACPVRGASSSLRVHPAAARGIGPGWAVVGLCGLRPVPYSRVMTATEAPAPATFESLDPRTGDVVGTHPVHDGAAVRAAVARAASGAEWWDGIGAAERKRLLGAWRAVLVRKLDDLAAAVVEETGKPLDDARLELVLAIDHLDWAAKHTGKVLGRRKVAPGLLM